MTNLITINSLFKKADAISIDDVFIPYLDARDTEASGIEIIHEDDRFEFTKSHLDGAILDKELDVWTLFDSNEGKYVRVAFFLVTPLKI
ncbi:hypothetical protein BM526_19635 (plasmid) [Alteromonas mediterranea]|uniref:hypothetical protein n=1 Tax=Alteromonas mediterranea TaxID=314275 RepID=UPI000903353A|nr:hypothetical protein [Alteromonas mediterranea]APE04183.1 hypothetical protein BM526_19635 [Alteromonas mediterranea]